MTSTNAATMDTRTIGQTYYEQGTHNCSWEHLPESTKLRMEKEAQAFLANASRNESSKTITAIQAATLLMSGAELPAESPMFRLQLKSLDFSFDYGPDGDHDPKWTAHVFQGPYYWDNTDACIILVGVAASPVEAIARAIETVQQPYCEGGCLSPTNPQ